MKRKIIAFTTIIIMSFSCLGVITYEPAFAEDESATGVSSEQGGPAEPAGLNEMEEQLDEDSPLETIETEEPEESEPMPFVEMMPLVRTSHSGAAIKVSWEAVEGANGYKVYRQYGSDSRKVIATTKALSFRDGKVVSGKKATYYVRAYRGNEYTKYSKEVTDRIYRVYIETGHGIDSRGRWDPGCTWKGYQEAKLMLPIARAMTKYMRENGVYVYTDSESNNNHNLFWTLDFLNRHSVSAFVNLHCDYRYARSGTLPLYRTAKQKKLATALNRGVHSTVKIRNRGLQKRKGLYTLNSKKVHCASCLFETGSIKNDNKLLRKKYDAYGKGLAKGLCSYLHISFR